MVEISLRAESRGNLTSFKNERIMKDKRPANALDHGEGGDSIERYLTIGVFIA